MKIPPTWVGWGAYEVHVQILNEDTSCMNIYKDEMKLVCVVTRDNNVIN